MGSFKEVIDNLGLKEIRLNGHRFTWSNEQDSPTLTRIDNIFCTPEQELLFPTCFLHSLPSLVLDCPQRSDAEKKVYLTPGTDA